MNIAALVNPAPDAAPRRSPSRSQSRTAPNPAVSAAKLPTPPLSTHKALPMKRKRHDPKPIWAVREHELLDGLTLEQQQQQRQQSLPPPPTPRPQPQPAPMSAPLPEVPAQSNGTGPPVPQHLQGYERPISDDDLVYDEISRKVCDFIWNNVVENTLVRQVIVQSPATQVEIEARWGQITGREDSRRLVGIHETECVVASHVAEATKFESTMSLEQHKKMNNYLNQQAVDSNRPGSTRAKIQYKHTREVDMFYELDQDAFSRLHPLIKQMIHQSQTRQRIRVTRDEKTGQVIRKIIKHRIANQEISSPQTEWDYRIGINIEIEFPGPIEGLHPVVEAGRKLGDMERKKDRMSYSWLGAYQVDLTQVHQGMNKNHELELELDANVLIEAAEQVKRKQPNSFEPLVSGMINNLRVLSREITTVPQV